jgi:hypothetical protein
LVAQQSAGQHGAAGFPVECFGRPCCCPTAGHASFPADFRDCDSSHSECGAAKPIGDDAIVVPGGVGAADRWRCGVGECRSGAGRRHSSKFRLWVSTTFSHYVAASHKSIDGWADLQTDWNTRTGSANTIRGGSNLCGPDHAAQSRDTVTELVRSAK